MGDEKPPEAEQPMPAQREAKPETCLDCGFVTVDGSELSKMDRAYLKLIRFDYDWESISKPRNATQMFCFKGLWGRQYVVTECEEDWY